MPPTTDTSGQATAVDFAHRIVPLWQAALRSELLGVYLIGSLAHGGFSRRYSDIDMALVTEAGISPQTLDRVRNQAAAMSADWGAKLSVFWTDRLFGVGRFPPLDRIDYLDHAVVLMERECVRPVRPTLEEIQHYLSGAPFANWTDQAQRFATAERLQPKDRKPFSADAPLSRAVLLHLADRSHGLERRRCGVSEHSRALAARPEFDHPCAAMSPGRRRPRLTISCTNEAAVSG